MIDEELYRRAAEELDSGNRRPDLWAQACSLASTDHDEARFLYTNLRVEELLAEKEASPDQSDNSGGEKVAAPDSAAGEYVFDGDDALNDESASDDSADDEPFGNILPHIASVDDVELDAVEFSDGLTTEPGIESTRQGETADLDAQSLQSNSSKDDYKQDVLDLAALDELELSGTPSERDLARLELHKDDEIGLEPEELERMNQAQFNTVSSLDGEDIPAADIEQRVDEIAAALQVRDLDASTDPHDFSKEMSDDFDLDEVMGTGAIDRAVAEAGIDADDIADEVAAIEMALDVEQRIAEADSVDTLDAVESLDADEPLDTLMAVDTLGEQDSFEEHDALGASGAVEQRDSLESAAFDGALDASDAFDEIELSEAIEPAMADDALKTDVSLSDVHFDDRSPAQTAADLIDKDGALDAINFDEHEEFDKNTEALAAEIEALPTNELPLVTDEEVEAAVAAELAAEALAAESLAADARAAENAAGNFESLEAVDAFGTPESLEPVAGQTISLDEDPQLEFNEELAKQALNEPDLSTPTLSKEEFDFPAADDLFAQDSITEPAFVSGDNAQAPIDALENRAIEGEAESQDAVDELLADLAAESHKRNPTDDIDAGAGIPVSHSASYTAELDWIDEEEANRVAAAKAAEAARQIEQNEEKVVTQRIKPNIPAPAVGAGAGMITGKLDAGGYRTYSLFARADGHWQAVNQGVSWSALGLTLPWLIYRKLYVNAVIYALLWIVCVTGLIITGLAWLDSSGEGMSIVPWLAVGFALLTFLGLFYVPFRHANQWRMAKLQDRGFEKVGEVQSLNSQRALGVMQNQLAMVRQRH